MKLKLSGQYTFGQKKNYLGKYNDVKKCDLCISRIY